MSEQKNASHVGGKQESRNRDKRAEEREIHWKRSIKKENERQEVGDRWWKCHSKEEL